jgi:hypothetical protein
MVGEPQFQLNSVKVPRAQRKVVRVRFSGEAESLNRRGLSGGNHGAASYSERCRRCHSRRRDGSRPIMLPILRPAGRLLRPPISSRWYGAAEQLSLRIARLRAVRVIVRRDSCCRLSLVCEEKTPPGVHKLNGRSKFRIGTFPNFRPMEEGADAIGKSVGRA